MIPLENDHTPTDAPADFKRDRWGRPVIDGVACQRASSVAKLLEDTYNLEQWHRRNVAYGIAHDASLSARILAVGGAPDTWVRDDKKAVDEIITAANVAAKSHKRADIGTALHALMEKVDRGQDVDAGPYAADIDAYRQALDDLGLLADPAYVEVKMGNIGLAVAGTCDNLVMRRGDKIHHAADKKTGSTVAFGALGYAAQLAAYAGGQLWDVVNDRPLPTPTIDQTVGYIIHVPASEGRCDVYAVELEPGRKAIELANSIRTIRRESKRWMQPIAAPERTANVSVESPAGDVPPASPAATRNSDRFGRPVLPKPAEGDDADPVAVVDLKARYEALDGDGRAWLGAIAKGATAHGGSISLAPSQPQSRRRWRCMDALVSLAAAGFTDDDSLRGVLRPVLGDVADMASFNLGQLVGCLSPDEAATFCELANTVATESVALIITDDGRHVWEVPGVTA